MTAIVAKREHSLTFPETNGTEKEKKARTVPQRWQDRTLTVDEAMKKMEANFNKAITEHTTAKKEDIYLEKRENLKALNATIKPSPLKLSMQEAEHQKEPQCLRDGKRQMEDRHFYKELDDGYLVGVFDGHGGHDVSDFVCNQIKTHFPIYLKAANGNVHQAFETLFVNTNLLISLKKELDGIGSTAVVSYIDRKTHLIYTATLADSEAVIYRKIDENYKAIPLSCVRDWSSKKDSLRAASALKKPELAEQWQTALNPKKLRFPLPACGINVSRCFGDIGYNKMDVAHPEKIDETVTCKPKITVCELEPNDIVQLSSDGFMDFVKQNEAVQQIVENEPQRNTADTLVEFAVEKKKSNDDVTVVLLRVTV